jgi:hypothetical protein
MLLWGALQRAPQGHELPLLHLCVQQRPPPNPACLAPSLPSPIPCYLIPTSPAPIWSGVGGREEVRATPYNPPSAPGQPPSRH